MVYLALGALVFAYSFKHSNNGGVGEPAISNKSIITIKGDDVIVNKLNTIKVKKSSSWKEIKQKVIQKITPKEGK